MGKEGNPSKDTSFSRKARKEVRYVSAVEILTDAFEKVPWFIPLLIVYAICNNTIFKKH